LNRNQTKSFARLKTLAENNPADEQISLIFAYVQYKRQDYQDAITTLTRVIDANLDSKYPSPYYLRCLCLCKLFEYSRALQDLGVTGLPLDG
jgi:outer membrane protein assembly factor BamD (BamD/ComL family)